MPFIEAPLNATFVQVPYAPDYLPTIVGETEEYEYSTFIMTMFGMMLIFFIGAGIVEKYKPPVCHETSVVLVIGIAFSFVYYACVGSADRAVFKFSQGVFFDFFLPPIIINSGYNMRRKKFFQNLGNVAIFGLGVTFVCFTLYSVMTWLFISNGLFYMSNYGGINLNDEESYQKVVINTLPLLLFTSLLCSSDVVAAVSIVSYSEQPKLYSCIFGEGIVNDIVSIILFNCIYGLQSTAFSAVTPVIILGQFVILGIVSVLMGVIFGCLTSLLFKHARFLTASPVTEMFVMLGFSIICYFCTGIIKILGTEMSGIIALLTCSIINGHYTFYNFSPQGKSTSSVTVAFLGNTFEAAVYSYIGIALYSCIPIWWSFSFILTEFFIIVIFRFIGVMGTFYTARLCCKRKTIAFRELLFITYGGMIRGAIAFALVLKITVVDTCGKIGDQPLEGCYTQKNYDLVVTTTLALVYITTLIFGTFMTFVQKKLVPPKEEDQHEFDEMQEDRDRAASQIEMQRSMSANTHYSEIVHPNYETTSETDNKNKQRTTSEAISVMNPDGSAKNWSWSRSGLVNWFLRVDESHIKPFLIRNYDRIIQQLEDEYQDQLKVNFMVDDKDKIAERVEALRETQSAIGRAASFNFDPNNNSALLKIERTLSTNKMPRTQSQFNPTAQALGLDAGFRKDLEGQAKARAASDFNMNLKPDFGAKPDMDAGMDIIREEEEMNDGVQAPASPQMVRDEVNELSDSIQNLHE